MGAGQESMHGLPTDKATREVSKCSSKGFYQKAVDGNPTSSTYTSVQSLGHLFSLVEHTCTSSAS